jgi:uncharacterized protein YdeI (YjbR/CyaY-like superfamily)
VNTLDVRDAVAWRAWLAKHHQSASEVWLVFHKRHTGTPSISYDAAVDEALCFGWIDSLIKRLDDARYARKFTPRKPDSRWSAANRKRYARLRAEGRLTAAGLQRPPSSRSYDQPRPASSAVPQYIRRALRGRPAAWTNFHRLAPSDRRLYVGWIDSAKQQETKLRRLREAVDRLAAGKKLGLK